MERFLEPEDRAPGLLRCPDRLRQHAQGCPEYDVVFYETTPERQIQTYKRDLKFFHNLRMSVKLRYAEAIDFRDYEQKIRKLLDDHIDAQGVKTAHQPEVEIFNVEQFDQVVERTVHVRVPAPKPSSTTSSAPPLEKMETRSGLLPQLLADDRGDARRPSSKAA